MERELERIFTDNKLRLTKPRRAVFKILHDNDKPLSTAHIAKQSNMIDRSSVYRTIELFTNLGIVKAVPIGWKQRYELTGPFKSHHHHLSCTKCGRLIDLESPDFERMVANLAAKHDFDAHDHMFEIRGLCKNCR